MQYNFIKENIIKLSVLNQSLHIKGNIVNRRIKKINSRDIREIIKELDKIELEYKSIGFTDRKDVYVCPECEYLGTKCYTCAD